MAENDFVINTYRVVQHEKCKDQDMPKNRPNFFARKKYQTTLN